MPVLYKYMDLDEKDLTDRGSSSNKKKCRIVATPVLSDVKMCDILGKSFSKKNVKKRDKMSCAKNVCG